MNDPQTLVLIDELRKMPAELPWLEFKENNTDPKMIGKLISALSNAARLADQQYAFVVWGIRDDNHEAVGTTFVPSRKIQKDQHLDLWLAQRLQPGIAFTFETIDYRGTNVVLLRIPAATDHPVEFDRTAYIRLGITTPRLSDHPERLKELWGKFHSYTWETGFAAQYLDSDDVIGRLDYVSYFDLTRQPLPDNRHGILSRLAADQLAQQDFGGHWSITNLGAILFAKRLDEFPSSIARKAIRFVAYDGPSRAEIVIQRQDVQRGYAAGFKELVDYIGNLLPRKEKLTGIYREELSVYPLLAIREVIANALIHQDMTVTGTGPLVEMFSDRLEITNPGLPLVSPERFLDFPPRSRNEALASLMRRMGLCEEQGTGIDKVITAIELHQLPPPDFRAEGGAVRAILFAPRRFTQMTPDERIRACYQHAALKFITGSRMKNSTLCKRFGIDPKNASQASTVIRQTIKAELIKPADSEHPRAGYIPYWA